ncbi:MAG: hypothetical protein R3C17_18705 [Planctomycetaceae bacterium]
MIDSGVTDPENTTIGVSRQRTDGTRFFRTDTRRDNIRFSVCIDLVRVYHGERQRENIRGPGLLGAQMSL